MNRNQQYCFLYFIVLGCILSSVSAVTSEGWVNVDVTRNLDLVSQLARSTIQIKAKNEGSDTKNYRLALDDSYVASIQAMADDDSLLQVTQLSEKYNKLYNIELKNVVKSGSSVSLKVKITLMGQMKPYPTHISQNEVQLVKYFDNTYFTSPYKTLTQKTSVKLASTRIESQTDVNPTTIKGSSITYGPYKDVAAYKVEPMVIHFENNAPFLVLTQVVKEYEVSHWGNLAVETNYHVEHGGAKLKGPWSRLDYQRNPMGASPSHIPEIHETVPRDSADFYYRDYIGNISTSSYVYNSNSITLKIVPRFPLFGGWKNEFLTGFNLPINKFLSKDLDSGLYVLNVTFGVGIENIYTKRHVVKIVLPEGATDIKVSAPFAFTQTAEIRKTFLDTVGRPVIVLEASNIASENYQNFQLTYNLSPLSILHEPLLAIGAVFTLCLIIMAYVRFEMSIITKPVNKIVRNPECDKLAQQFLELFESRIEYHNEVEVAIENQARNQSAFVSFTNQKSLIDSKYKETNSIGKLISSISAIDPTYATHLKELHDLEIQLGHIQAQIIDYESKARTKTALAPEIKEKLQLNYLKTNNNLVYHFNQLLN
eukprot:gene5689-7079_t